jgi:hypothetical protein
LRKNAKCQTQGPSLSSPGDLNGLCFGGLSSIIGSVIGSVIGSIISSILYI